MHSNFMLSELFAMYMRRPSILVHVYDDWIPKIQHYHTNQKFSRQVFEQVLSELFALDMSRPPILVYVCDDWIPKIHHYRTNRKFSKQVFERLQKWVSYNVLCCDDYTSSCITLPIAYNMGCSHICIELARC